MSINVIKNKDLQSTAIVAFGSIIGSFFAYLLQFFLGRMLSIEDYGSFSAFLSLSTILSVINSIIVVSSVKTVSVMSANNDHEKITKLYFTIIKASFFYGSFIFLTLFSLRYSISNKLNINNVQAVMWFAILQGLTILPNISRAFFQGMLKYWGLSTYVVYSGFFRFIFPVVLVYFGFGLPGVFSGMTVGFIISYLVSILVLRSNFTKITDVSVNEELKDLVKLGLPVALTNLGLMGMNNVDMILVKRFFDSTTAGYYAGTVTLGKILLFGAGAVTVVMFPKVSSARAKNEDYKHIAASLFKIQILLVIGGMLVFGIFPEFITQLFFGERFVNSVKYLPRFSIYIGLYTLINGLVMYFLAIDKRKVSLILVPALLLQYILITLFHTSIMMVIGINLGICLIVLTFLYILYNRS